MADNLYVGPYPVGSVLKITGGDYCRCNSLKCVNVSQIFVVEKRTWVQGRLFKKHYSRRILVPLTPVSCDLHEDIFCQYHKNCTTIGCNVEKIGNIEDF